MSDDQEVSMPSKTQTAETTMRERAEELVTAREVLAQWESRGREASQDLEHLESKLGMMALQSPDRGDELGRELQALRDRVTVADRAARAQRVLVPPLEQAYLLAVADLIEERDLAPAQAAYDEHAALLSKALRQVEKLEGAEGRFVPDYLEKVSALTAGQSYSYTVPRSEALATVAQTAERQVQMVRKLAAGGTLTPVALANGSALDLPPEVWGPDALVPAAGYLESVDQARHELAAARRELEALPAEYEAAAEQARRSAVPVPSPEEWMGMREANLQAAVDAARGRLADLEGHERDEVAA